MKPHSSLLDFLPPDCTNILLSYLTLQECLRYGSTCNSCLQNVLPNLSHRRYISFLCPHEFDAIRSTQSDHKPAAVGQLLTPIMPSSNDDDDDAHNDIVTLLDDEKWIIRPVHVRLHRLHRVLPSQHPSTNDICDYRP